MQKELIVESKTIEKAMREISDHFGVEQEEISFEVLETPKKGFLGLMSTGAKVKGTYALTKVEIATLKLTDLLTGMGAENFTLRDEPNKNGALLSISGDNLGFVIGRKGEVLESIQYIINMMINLHHEDAYFRILLDCNGYREEHQEKLKSLAEKMVLRVIKTGQSVTMEPMTSYDRRIVHTVIQESAGVTSSSVGVEPRRCVVIRPAK